MKTHISRARGQEGFVLVYMATVLALLMVATGLAVDSGRMYVVKAQLSKAVDGAVLAAARNLNGGDPKGQAPRMFKDTFPAAYMGPPSSPDPTADPNFFATSVNTASGNNVATVTPTTMMPAS